MANAIRTEKYIKSDVGNNNNKFWYVTLFDNGDVLTEWGRVGDKGQSKMFPGAGVSFLEKKCREKEKYRNGEIPYRKLNVVDSNSTVTVSKQAAAQKDIKEIAKSQIKSNNPLVTKLIEYLAKVNAHQILIGSGGKITYNDTTGLFSTPLGIVTQENIDQANTILTDIGDLVASGRYDSNKLGGLTNDYMMLIPADIGHKRLVPREFWSDLTKVQAQKQILDNLQVSLATATTNPSRKSTIVLPEKQIFDCQLHLVDDKKEIDRIRSFYKKTWQRNHQCHHLDVKTIYSVDINTVNESFEKDGAKMNNVWELWHGTRASNLLSILRGGLVIPPSSSPHVCGRLYGDGLYFSDMSTKSLNYAYGYWSKSGGTDDNCFMFLCSVAMGNFYNPSRSSYTSTRYPVKGYDSTFAKAGSGVMNNEMIVYRLGQCRLNRLVEFSPSGK